MFDLTIAERHLSATQKLVARPDGVEGAAYLLFGTSRIDRDPWERRMRTRFMSHEVIAIPPEDRISESANHVTWSTASYVRLLRCAQRENLIPAIVHTHPDGPASFSPQDDDNERRLYQLAKNRNGSDAKLLSLLLTGDSLPLARLWLDTKAPIDVPARSVGRHLSFAESGNAPDADFLARQALAFGSKLNKTLRQMRIGIVGCGGTGSATAMLLARLGVGHLALFDDDIVEATNLNRLHGAKRSDVDGMRSRS